MNKIIWLSNHPVHSWVETSQIIGLIQQSWGLIKFAQYYELMKLPLAPKTLHNPGGLRTVAKQMSNINSYSGLGQKFPTKLVSHPSRIQGFPSPWTEVNLCPNIHLPRMITIYRLVFYCRGDKARYGYAKNPKFSL